MRAVNVLKKDGTATKMPGSQGDLNDVFISGVSAEVFEMWLTVYSLYNIADGPLNWVKWARDAPNEVEKLSKPLHKCNSAAGAISRERQVCVILSAPVEYQDKAVW